MNAAALIAAAAAWALLAGITGTLLGKAIRLADDAQAGAR